MSEIVTGERLETIVFNEVSIEHLHRYAMAMELAKNKIVLDIASGEGYGSNLVAQYANKVIGVDISNDAIERARKKYKSSNLEFRHGSTSNIPAENNSCDFVISFETIEHHNEHDLMMAEIKRVLKPNGKLLISTPEKKLYSDATNHKNKFHVKELYFDEFKSLISNYFNYSSYFFQNNITGSLILPEKGYACELKFYKGDFENINNDAFAGLYNLCLASNESIQLNYASFFDSRLVQELIYTEMNKSFASNIARVHALYHNSWSFRVGRLATWPLRLFRKTNASMKNL